jgi:hypothetical protein
MECWSDVKKENNFFPILHYFNTPSLPFKHGKHVVFIKWIEFFGVTEPWKPNK